MPRAAGRYSGCYVRATVSGDFSDRTLASDAHLHTCGAGTRGLFIVPYSRQHGTVGDRTAVGAEPTRLSLHACVVRNHLRRLTSIIHRDAVDHTIPVFPTVQDCVA